jgi:hypothetical protein
MGAIALWQPDLTSGLEDAKTKILARLEQLSADAPSETQPGTQTAFTSEQVRGTVGNSMAPTTPITNQPLLTQSELWSAFEDARSLPVVGDQTLLGPGVGYNPVAIKRAVDEIVELEGPISQDRLASVVVGRFGMSRVKSTRLDSLIAHFKHLTTTKSPFGVTYWSTQRPPASWSGFRTSTGDESRTLEEVPAEELSNAMVAVIKLGGTATDEEVLRFVSDGYERKLTEKVRTRLSDILEWTVQSGRLVRKDGLLVTVES